MATEFKWSLPTLERHTADGFVYTAHWRATATDGDYSASSYGTAGFQQDPEAGDLIPYEDLTEEQVLGWLWNSIDKDATEAALQAKIDGDMNPTTGTGTPW
jgi:hypothetical protein